jgi:hypothetical protein
LALVLACSLCPAILGAQASVADKRLAVRIGIARLSAENLSENQKTMTDTIPMRLKANLESLKTRSLGDDEREAYRSASLLAKVLELGKSLDEQLGQYDMKILSEKTAKDAAASRKSLKPGIQKARKDLDDYAKIPLSDIEVSVSMPIDWVLPQGGAELLEAPVAGQKAYCEKQNLDILISGSLKGSGEYAFLEVYAYHRFLDKRIFEWKTALADDDTQSAIDEFSAVLAQSLLGRKTGSLRISALPERAEIRINGNFAGNSPSVTPFADSGSYAVSVSAPGYVAEERNVSVEEGLDAALSFDLAALPQPTIGLTSVPEGADIYLEGQKIGQTPLDLGQNGQIRSFRARKEGYKDSSFVVDGKTSGQLKVSLTSLEDSKKNSFARQKDRFYYAAGAFMVSLPFSVLCVGMYNQYSSNLDRVNAGTYTAEQKAEAGTLMDGPGESWRLAAIGTSALSSGLLGFAVYRFFWYLKSSQ